MNRSQLRSINQYKTLNQHLSDQKRRQFIQFANPSTVATKGSRDPLTGKVQCFSLEGGSIQATFISSTSGLVDGAIVPALLDNWLDAKPSL